MPDPKDENLKPSSAKASEGEEEDKVAAAYENISKKLESIRSGKTPEDDEEPKESKDSDESEDEHELEEWKGPKGVKAQEDGDEGETEDMELRKVKLKNLEEPEESKVSDEEDELEVDQKQEPERPSGKETTKDWEPKENDPLDEEDAEEESKASEVSKEPEGAEKESDEGIGETGSEDSEHPESQRTEEPQKIPSDEPEMDLPKRQPQPDTLDDLTKEEDYDIPHLKGSRQGGSGIGYNAAPEMESFSQDSRNKSSMETKQSFSSNNDPNNFFSQTNMTQPPKRANKFHLLVLVIIGIAVIGFTVYILKGGFGEIGIGPSSPSPSPTVEATSTPTPTPTPEPDRASLKVRILNGSGKTGLAKTVSDKLKDLGYQIDKTGNATNSAFTQTIVRVKTKNESFIPQVVKDLTPDFEAAGNTSLKDDDSADIEIILGAK